MSKYGNFGRCETEDACVLDPECEFYHEHLESGGVPGYLEADDPEEP